MGGVNKKRPTLEVNVNELNTILDDALATPLTEDNHKKIKTALNTMAEQLAGGFRTSDKKSKLLADLLNEPKKSPLGADADKSWLEPDKGDSKPGHGRRAAADYTGATKVSVSHPTLTSGCACPDPHCRGKVYPLKSRSPRVRITGMTPFQATVYELDCLRCNQCETVYTAPEPAGVGPDKYDETVVSMVGLLKYGLGVPFNRLERLQHYLGVDFARSTQWELVADAAEILKPLYNEFLRQGAQGDTIQTDDTVARIIDVVRPEDDKRTGLHTTGVVSVLDEGRRFVALYLSGTQHAGENLRDILTWREKGAPAPILMHDALAANECKLSEEFRAFLANCLTHGRRKFADGLDSFPAECRHVLEELAEVYAYDAQAKELKLDAKARLIFHQRHSGPVMKGLHFWMTAQLKEKRVEPNSNLGKTFTYMLTHWQKLTLFLRHPGAPLDSNLVERCLKKAVLHRKNALFYRTLNGAQVGDLFMSLIHTCELNDVNPFDYLNAVQQHPLELRANPSAWMPWNYQEQLQPAPD